MFARVPYTAPAWASGRLSAPPPAERVRLGQFPTPVHRLEGVPFVPDGVELWVKRDDLTGSQLSGNKVRKLEFLLADALAQGSDSVVTIGGVQSNHCRATAVACRYLGMDSHLVLRTRRSEVDADPGLVGNLMVERLVGAHTWMCSKEEYVRHGSEALGEALCGRLRAEGKRPYLVPVGGSNALGTWGYLEFADELLRQQREAGAAPWDCVAMACGSGGTSAGVALGCALSGAGASVRAYGVCDDEAYFYGYIGGLLEGLGACGEGLSPEELVTCRQAKGVGYAAATEEEVAFVRDVALATGIVLDPVYTGKALLGLARDMAADPEAWQGKRVLFVHTGGMLGLYEKASQLQPLVEQMGTAHRFPVDELERAG